LASFAIRCQFREFAYDRDESFGLLEYHSVAIVFEEFKPYLQSILDSVNGDWGDRTIYNSVLAGRSHCGRGAMTYGRSETIVFECECFIHSLNSEIAARLLS
jgi:hypothetical protein